MASGVKEEKKEAAQFFVNAAKEAGAEVPEEALDEAGDQQDDADDLKPVQTEEQNQEVEQTEQTQEADQSPSKAEFDKLKEQLDFLQAKQDPNSLNDVVEQQQVVMPEAPKPPQEPPMPDDPTDHESMTQYMRDLTTFSRDQAEFIAQKAINDRILPMEYSHFSREHQFEVDAAAKEFGEEFDWEKEGPVITKMREKLPGLRIADAYRVLKYNETREQVNRLKQATTQRENTKTVNSATSTMQKEDKQTEFALSPEEKTFAQKMNMSQEEYHASKQEHLKATGEA